MNNDIPASIDENSIQSKGGVARREALSPETRRDIARKAAQARWSTSIPNASHFGPLTIGGTQFECAVLDDGSRVFTRATLVRAMGRKGKVKGGRAWDKEFQVPVFLTAENLKPFISKELEENSKTIQFRYQNQLYLGYKIDLLRLVCELFIDANDAGVLRFNQTHIAKACKALYRGFAGVGLIALVDEATGYQYVRDRLALQDILDQYIGRELAKWAKRFPDEFYQQIFRLKGSSYNPESSKRPMIMAHLTIDLVYDRLGPGLTKELKERRQEILENTGKRGKLQQILTPNVGHPALQHHLSGLIFLAKSFSDGDWNGFYRAMNRVAQRYNRTMPLPFEENSTSTNGREPLSSQ